MLTPKVWIEDQTMYSQTSFFYRLLTLFSFLHTVEVDGKRRVIHISTCWFWWIKSEKTIPFDRIDVIETKCDAVEVKDDHRPTYSSPEAYIIVLNLKNPREKCRLISFPHISDFHSYLDELRKLVKGGTQGRDKSRICDIYGKI